MTTPSRALAASLLALAFLSVPAAAQEKPASRADKASVSVYLDSAAAARTLAALPAPELPEGIAPLFSLWFNGIGAVEAAEGVYTQLPDSFAGPVASILRAHARLQPPSDHPEPTFLRVTTGPGATISRAEVDVTVPAYLNPSFAVDLIKPVLRRREEAVGRDVVRKVDVAIRVLTDGSVDPASVRLVGTTGDAQIDRTAFVLVHQLRFRPGAVEGIPAPVRVYVPFHVAGGMAGPHSEYQATEVESVPREVPFSALVDSAALAGELAALPALPNPERAYFRVRFDTAGAVSGVEAVHPGLPDDRARAVAEAVRRHVRRRPISPEPLHLYLRVTPGPGASVERRGPSIVRATLANQEPVRRLIREAPVKGVADMVFAVTADGEPDPASIEFVGRAPLPEVANAARQVVGQMRFRPGIASRLPVSTWLRVFLWLGQPSEF